MNHSDTSGATRPDCISLVAAIIDKYGFCDDPCGILPNCSENGLEPVLFMKRKPFTKNDKSKGREIVILNEQQVSCAGDADQLKHLLSAVTHLDLSKNLFSCPKEVCQILFHCYPVLEHCDLSYNLPSSVYLFPNDYGIRFPRLKRLVLNGTQIKLTGLLDILSNCPCIEELHLSLNDFSTIEEQFAQLSSPLHFHTVHVLHVNNCSINTWTALGAFDALFPCLEILVAVENPIHEISCTATTSSRITSPKDDNEDNSTLLPTSFANLHSFNFSRWLIDDWCSIDQLRHVPILNEIRALGLPLFDHYSDDERRMLFIARLPDLTSLNGSTVSSTQREDAERFFIRFYLDAEDKPQRYHELINIHGRLNKLLDVDLSPKTSAEVRLVFDDENRSEKRSISLNQNVAQFKKSLRSFCDLPPNRIRLWYLDAEVGHVFGMDELRYPGVMLHALRITDGDEFHIQVKPESLRRTTSGSTTSSGQASPSKR